jgi:tetratricopeptide (TPR) repeat protein
MGDLKPGIEHINNAIEVAAAVHGSKSSQVAALLSYVMRAQRRLGDFDALIASGTKAVDVSIDQSSGTRAMTTLGRDYLLARRLGQAEEHLRKAIVTEKAYDTGKGSWLPLAQADYATTLLLLGRIDEAESVLQQNSPIVAAARRANTLPHWNAVGLAKRMAGQWNESEQAYRQVLERANDSVVEARWRADALNGVGIAQLELGRTLEAETSFREADKAARIAFLNMTPTRADVHVSLARVLLQLKRAADALPLIEEADLFWQHYDANNRWAGEAAYWRGQTLIAMGKKQDARSALLRAAEILRKSSIASDAKLAEAAIVASRG